LYHQAYLQFNDQSYSPQYQATPQQQSEAEPPPPMSSDFQDQMLKFMSKMGQIINSQNQIVKSQQEKYTPQFFAEIDAKIETHFEQIMKHLNREEEELQNQPKANLDGHYMVDESTSYHEQAITTMKNREVVETHVEERKEKQIEAPQALHWAKGKEVSTEVPSSPTLILKRPYEPRAPIAYDLPRG
jgi:ABC-type proline/glycine betaine transport system ATPase subunit